MADPRMDWEIVYRSASETDCREHALVLDAAGIANQVRQASREFTVAVALADAERSRAELDAYAGENPNRPEARSAVSRPACGWSGVLCFSVVLLSTALLEHRHAFGVDWFEAGKTHTGLIRQGEWWRTVTALTLHVDGAHLLANLILGGLFGLFAGQSLGSGLAWLCILAAGALGNLSNACLRPVEHTSIGASTAIFGALGLLAAQAWRRRRLRTSRMARWAPIVGGVLLLSFLGTGGVRTDVAAHVFGFISGALLGAVCGKLGEGAAPSARAQFRFGLAAMAIIAVAWVLALAGQAP